MKKIKKAQDGKEVEAVKKFHTDYINSPNYRQRLTNQGYTNVNGVIKERIGNLNSTRAIYNPLFNPEYHFDNPKDKFVTYINEEGYPERSVLSHELSHATGAMELGQESSKNLNLNKNEIKQLTTRNKLSKYTDADLDSIKNSDSYDGMFRVMHDRKASENKAYLDALRYNLKRDKLYDTGNQQFNKTLLDKAKKKYKDDEVVSPLFNNYEDKDLIWLMNNIAMNKTNKTNTASAKDGTVIKDNRGQWAHPGKVTQIDSNNITMRGVNYPVLGISDTNDKKLMFPGGNYKFKGTNVTEYPIMENGGELSYEIDKEYDLDEKEIKRLRKLGYGFDIIK